MRSIWNRPDRVRAACTALAVFFVTSARAQQSTEEPKYSSTPTGSVIGYVVYDDMKLPVRFAEIRLVPKRTEADRVRIEEETNASNPPKPQLRMASGISVMDGSFRIDGVPVGDYFAGAVMPGYLTSGTAAAANTATGEQLKGLVASMPTVHVAAGQVASVNLTVHRGAVIAGRVQFADGSPAIGAKVQWELAERDLEIESVRMAKPSPQQEIILEFGYHPRQGNGVETDDEGRYRIFGLPAGKYIVSTIIASQLGSGQITMSDGSGSRASGRERIYPNMTTVYGPGVFRRSDAKVFEIRGDEQVMDADVKVDPSGLHTVRGRILAGEDRHVPSQAMLRLRENGKNISRFAMIEDDGSFQIDYLPSGSYTLVVTGSPDKSIPASSTDSPRVLRNYKVAEVDFIVGGQDVVLDSVLLIALKPGEKMEWPR